MQTQLWQGFATDREEHPMGDMTFEQATVVKAVESALIEQGKLGSELRVSTPGGRFQVRWDENGSASALGQLSSSGTRHPVARHLRTGICSD